MRRDGTKCNREKGVSVIFIENGIRVGSFSFTRGVYTERQEGVTFLYFSSFPLLALPRSGERENAREFEKGLLLLARRILPAVL